MECSKRRLYPQESSWAKLLHESRPQLAGLVQKKQGSQAMGLGVLLRIRSWTVAWAEAPRHEARRHLEHSNVARNVRSRGDVP